MRIIYENNICIYSYLFKGTCNSLFCENGGACIFALGIAYCHCPRYFVGDICQTGKRKVTFHGSYLLNSVSEDA